MSSRPHHIGPERQLFIDGDLIDSLDGLARTLNSPQKQSHPVLEGTEPWDSCSVGICGNSVQYDADDGCFKIWYDSRAGVAYATSPDGIHWERPSLGLLEYDGSTDNNLVIPGRNLSVIKDRREPDPSKRYKGLYWHSLGQRDAPWGSKGHFVAFSEDGIRWHPHPGNPVLNVGDGVTDGQFLLGWDDDHGRYVAYMRPRVDFFDPPKRTSAWVGSDDFINWDPPVLAMAPDEREGAHAEYYRMTVAKYEGAYAGFVWIYNNDPGLAEQSRDTKLASSRDGIGWEKVSESNFLETGAKGEWDSQYACICNLIEVDDELFLYYSGANIPHDVRGEDGKRKSVREYIGKEIDGERWAYAIGLAKLRRDGFIAVEPKAGEGRLTTKPLTFHGTKLSLNVDSSKGRLEVELLDRHGVPVAGYTRSDCEPIAVDSTCCEVRWRANDDLLGAAIVPDDINERRRVLRAPVRLRFHLTDAKLYSFCID